LNYNPEKTLIVYIRKPESSEIILSDDSSIVFDIVYEKDKMRLVENLLNQRVRPEIDTIIIYGTRFPVNENTNAAFGDILRYLTWGMFLKHDLVPNFVFITQMDNLDLQSWLTEIKYHTMEGRSKVMPCICHKFQ
jgi:hypothetical protein